MTFEKAIIDAGQSFAAGQVYVALSRLTSLNGLVLHSRIPAQGIEMPEAVTDFCRREMDEDLLSALVLDEEQAFAQEQLVKWFSFEKLGEAWTDFHSNYTHRGIPNVNEALDWSDGVLKSIDKLEGTARKFRTQLEGMLGRKTDWPAVKERVEAAQKWFVASLKEQVLDPLQEHFKAWSIKPRSRQYLGDLRNLETAALQLRKGWQQAQQLTISLAGGTSYADIILDVPLEASSLKAEAAKAKPKKGDTYAVTLAMYKEGKSIAQIAAERGVTTGTIEGHLTRFIPTGEVDISSFVTKEQYRRIVEELERQETAQVVSTSAIKAALDDDYSYSMIRAVQVHRNNNAVFEPDK